MAFFFPLINAFSGAFLNGPPEERTEQFLRAQVICTDYALWAEIDGRPVRNPERHFAQSPLFDAQLPQGQRPGRRSSASRRWRTPR